MLLGFLLGVYCMGALATFLFTGFFAALGGRSEDLWMPFACGCLWPFYWPWSIAYHIAWIRKRRNDK